jgi:hypothetical protein
MFQPDIFKSAMDIVVDNFDSPSRRIGGDRKSGAVCESSHRSTKLFGFPGFNLVCFIQHTMTEIAANGIGALTLWIVYPLPKGLISHF